MGFFIHAVFITMSKVENLQGYTVYLSKLCR